ncbi:MAG: hypothetical protein A3G75_11890 [Verrucomicrobia bacterium RIFCSPLOWO2_12_FULL_64_8]|nr:MAG: hypothetical protein A3G75_11890 [Verrucomicrobia bacterium RIFCSPLOWO2_12_FULL_64_8]
MGFRAQSAQGHGGARKATGNFGKGLNFFERDWIPLLYKQEITDRHRIPALNQIGKAPVFFRSAFYDGLMESVHYVGIEAVVFPVVFVLVIPSILEHIGITVSIPVPVQDVRSDFSEIQTSDG